MITRQYLQAAKNMYFKKISANNVNAVSSVIMHAFLLITDRVNWQWQHKDSYNTNRQRMTMTPKRGLDFVRSTYFLKHSYAIKIKILLIQYNGRESGSCLWEINKSHWNYMN